MILRAGLGGAGAPPRARIPFVGFRWAFPRALLLIQLFDNSFIIGQLTFLYFKSLINAAPSARERAAVTWEPGRASATPCADAPPRTRGARESMRRHWARRGRSNVRSRTHVIPIRPR